MKIAKASQSESLYEEKRVRNVKCVVWDLDNTVWDGTLLEGGVNGILPGIADTMRILDERGILQSAASKNDHVLAMVHLEKYEIAHYLIYPQINWGAKSGSIERIAKDLNMGIDSLAFIDDQAFEREEVAFEHPSVLCLNANQVKIMLDWREFMPRFITEDSRRRREMYQVDIARKQVEENFEGPQESFLSSLCMTLHIGSAQSNDLKRAEELTLRTNQLNTTGYTYNYEELDFFRTSNSHKLLIAGLEDKYGPYGKIGLVLIDCQKREWTVKLLLMSCRVMARGVGTVLINHLRNEARRNKVRLFAEILPNDRNRMMYMTYKFNHFRELEKHDDLMLMENDLSIEHAFPTYMNIEIGL